MPHDGASTSPCAAPLARSNWLAECSMRSVASCRRSTVMVSVRQDVARGGKGAGSECRLASPAQPELLVGPLLREVELMEEVGPLKRRKRRLPHASRGRSLHPLTHRIGRSGSGLCSGHSGCTVPEEARGRPPSGAASSRLAPSDARCAPVSPSYSLLSLNEKNVHTTDRLPQLASIYSLPVVLSSLK